MKVEVLKVEISNGDVGDLYRAKAHLIQALSILSQQKIRESLGESLFYDLMKEMNNLVSGMDICMEIAGGRNGGPSGT